VLWRVTLVSALVLLAAPVRGDDNTESARAHYKKGLSAYALGRFKEAAAEYEAAFDLEPDSALLYNAAQAHRIAGDKERALLLYENYLRLFRSPPMEKDVKRYILSLKAAIDSEARARSTPPTEPIKSQVEGVSPPSPAPEPVEQKPQPEAAPMAPQPQVRAAAPPPEKKKTPKWVWGVVGGVAGVVVVGVAVGLAVGLSGTSYPSASSTVTLK
jgi:hypothetical protein